MKWQRFKKCATCGAGIAALSALGRLPIAGALAAPRTPEVVDLHVDLSYRVNYRGGDFGRGSGQFVASHLRRDGVGGVVLPLYIPRDVSPEGPRMSDLDASFERVVSLIPKTPPFALPGCSAPAGTVRTWLAFEGAAPLAKDPSAVERWTKRGVRLFGLVHTYDNALATSSGAGNARVGGLTDAGRDLVRRIHAAGGIVDVSHASDATTDDVLGIAEADHVPVVATHSNARTLAPHPRNLTDDQIRRIANTGGVVGVNFHSRFLAPSGRATLADVVRQIEYLVKVGGVDHVAIGSDFEGDISPPPELRDVDGFPRLSRALAARGMSRDDVAKVFGRNALRVLCPLQSVTAR
jgi:membrane dipeptidase